MNLNIDLLPPHCGVRVEPNDDGTEVRFQAFDDRDGRESLWSGWFTVTDEPIHLAWEAFEWPQ